MPNITSHLDSRAYTNLLNPEKGKIYVSTVNELSSKFGIERKKRRMFFFPSIHGLAHLKGFSGNVEYIATQGPLELTCRDFWKMVIQEQVKVIAMVSQFIELDKQKCHKYFPDNHETMSVGEKMEVECFTELAFETFCVRTLKIRKDEKEVIVTHLQFLGWPDFGCPAGTTNMLSFCQRFRESVRREKSLAIVHCSAGVGRTGTMISIDILLQAVEKNEDINIFETVFELRKQRTNMVQTEKQYFYIYTCINDFIEDPSMPICEENQNEDPIYDKTRILKSTFEPKSIEQHTESAF